MTDSPRQSDELYVGYLPVPAGHRRFLSALLPAMLAAIGLAAAAAALSQRDPGPAVWDTSIARTWEGVVRMAPYPMLEVAAGAGHGAGSSARETLLLVEMSKFGAQKRAAALADSRVRVTGWLMQREGRRMIELAPEDDAIAPAAGDAPPRSAPEALGRATLRGEIVDAKCFLGAMKPGDGKAHQACAVLCIAGGIPPMLVTRDGAGAPVFHLLASPEGGAADDAILPLVGVPVEAEGALERRGDLLIFRVTPTSIRPL